MCRLCILSRAVCKGPVGGDLPTKLHDHHLNYLVGDGNHMGSI